MICKAVPVFFSVETIKFIFHCSVQVWCSMFWLCRGPWSLVIQCPVASIYSPIKRSHPTILYFRRALTHELLHLFHPPSFCSSKVHNPPYCKRNRFLLQSGKPNGELHDKSGVTAWKPLKLPKKTFQICVISAPGMEYLLNIDQPSV